MQRNLEVSFNSPQCGWMSVGFRDADNEFHTTTAHTPYENALPELMRILGEALDVNSKTSDWTLKWNREPESFDFRFHRDNDYLTIKIYQYPTEVRDETAAQLVFVHRGLVREVVAAFAETLDRLYEDRETDEFEFNWRRPFPIKEYLEFKRLMRDAGI
ncbi:MAG: hypothetical protein ACK42A_07485 [Pyrinomonadaceae bacterium]|jgi:hypothetical protein